MNVDEARAWLRGERSNTNTMHDIGGSTANPMKRFAMIEVADAASCQQALVVLQAHRQGLLDDDDEWVDVAEVAVLRRERDEAVAENAANRLRAETAYAALRDREAGHEQVARLEAEVASWRAQVGDAQTELNRVEAERDDLSAILRTREAELDATMEGNRLSADTIRQLDERVSRTATEREARLQGKYDATRAELVEAIAQRDEAREWVGAVNAALGPHRTSCAFVDDAVARVVGALNDAEAKLALVTAERDGSREVCEVAGREMARMRGDLEQTRAACEKAVAQPLVRLGEQLWVGYDDHVSGYFVKGIGSDHKYVTLTLDPIGLRRDLDG